METLFTQIEWLPVLASTVFAMMLGYLWYSPVLFLSRWLKGLPEPPKWQAPMWMPMLAQAGSLLFLAIIVNQLIQSAQTALLALFVITLMGFTKANGMYVGKTKWSISVEVIYLLVSALLMVLVNVVL